MFIYMQFNIGEPFKKLRKTNIHGVLLFHNKTKIKKIFYQNISECSFKTSFLSNLKNIIHELGLNFSLFIRTFVLIIFVIVQNFCYFFSYLHVKLILHGIY